MSRKSSTRIVLGQINPVVGDIEANQNKIIEAAFQAIKQWQADLILLPELCLSGYPPEDLLFRQEFLQQIKTSIKAIKKKNLNIVIVFGAPVIMKNGLVNAAVVVRPNQDNIYYAKQKLPNYGVFDEQRYFVSSESAKVFELNGFIFGLSVCEDIWFSEPTFQAVQAGAEIMLNINASPYHRSKTTDRIHQVTQRIAETSVPVCYVNQVGGQDELVFDGHSFVLDKNQQLKIMAAGHEEQLAAIELTPDGDIIALSESVEQETDTVQLYQSLVLATHDYVVKNGFDGVLLGLSGGIDSALVLAIAVDALGAEQVQAVMMPYQYTSKMSLTDAAKQAETMQVKYSQIPIHQVVEAFMAALKSEFSGLKRDTSEENIQARSRGVILMALSNKLGKMLLTTGNKSEMAVGYATLYGDMAGGFAPLKDVSKMRVYELARYRNTLSPVIPERVIERPPSAELAPDQIDSDSLPAYEILDQILERYIEMDQSITEIIQAGFTEHEVRRVTRLVDINEYKRRQSPPGVRVSSKAFGKERRYPISSGFRSR